jgi:shikimate dehydrogenase
MKYGLIGERLSHSFSREIHKRLESNPYELVELKEEELKPFLEKRDFIGINVTMPYKAAVIPYLDAIHPIAKEIGAVNTIVNDNGKLTGYNTDYNGMEQTLNHFNLSVAKKTVAILGTGGTSATALTLCRALNAKTVYRVSRQAGEGVITYGELYGIADKIEVIINTTPVGMYPDIDGCPVDIDKFPALTGVADVIYNPLRSTLVMKAEKRGLEVASGLYMLVAQGLSASEKFVGERYGNERLCKLYMELMSEKENIVLIGMPSSGKTTVGKRLAELLGREFIDTDRLIEEMTEREISQIFAKGGEALFREKERAAIKEAAKKAV